MWQSGRRTLEVEAEERASTSRAESSASMLGAEQPVLRAFVRCRSVQLSECEVVPAERRRLDPTSSALALFIPATPLCRRCRPLAQLRSLQQPASRPTRRAPSRPRRAVPHLAPARSRPRQLAASASCTQSSTATRPSCASFPPRKTASWMTSCDDEPGASAPPPSPCEAGNPADSLFLVRQAGPPRLRRQGQAARGRRRRGVRRGGGAGRPARARRRAAGPPRHCSQPRQLPSRCVLSCSVI